ncbi:glyoxylate/hydroxypyruvate reductase HPR3-like [Humulus lupulus]|uniref:glyoxylate/hydroxypyruvate reductase HPR3-like n=1 Tax=Humulus lupulus TaxID=3486 RepID=UPI002B4069A8|nr:glyoxylate/hydroxypyruvate reductase HPR3-like [Humulus lupulus]
MENLQSQPDDRPEVLLIVRMVPALFSPLFNQKFRLMKAWESELPLDQFLARNASSVRAMIASHATAVNTELLQLLPALRLVVTSSKGVNQVDLAECRRRGISVANVGNAYTEDVADVAVGLLIDVLRKISAADRYVRHGFWKTEGDFPLAYKLGGKRVGIVGLGSIGCEVAKRLEAFGCLISYNSRSKKPSIAYPCYSNVKELAANNDIIILCCSLTDETHHMVNKEVLSALGKEGVIVNVGRGALIDEKELVRCLVVGDIRGAGLDVFENGSYVPEELFQLDNVVLSPHIAVFTPESFESAASVMIANLEAFFLNKPLLTPVTIP